MPRSKLAIFSLLVILVGILPIILVQLYIIPSGRFSFIYLYCVIPMISIISLILGILSFKKDLKQKKMQGKGIALAGIILSAILLILWFILIMIAIVIPNIS